MQVILLRDVSGIGQKGQIKNVSDGHALNYLIPNRLAEMATPDKVKALEKLNAENAKASEAREREWMSLSKQVDGKQIQITANASEQGHLYEKISAADVAEAIQDQLKLSIPTDAIAPKMALKEVGEWPVEVKLGKNNAQLIVVITRS